MKNTTKLLLAVIISLLTLSAAAQDRMGRDELWQSQRSEKDVSPVKAPNSRFEPKMFDLKEITNAIDTFTKVETKKTTKWATNVVKLGNIDNDHNISWKLNIPVRDSLYYGSLADCILKFVDKYRAYLQIDYKESSPEHVVIKTVVPKVLFSDGSLSFAMSIDAHGEMHIDVMPKRMILTMKVQRYVNTNPYGESGASQGETVFMRVSDVAPLKDTSEKKFWSRAFINANASCLNLADNFVRFLNNNYTNTTSY